MSKSKDIYLLGYSGHAFVVMDVALSNNYNIKGYFDFKEAIGNPYNVPFLGDESLLEIEEIVKEDFIFPAMGANAIRQRLSDFIEKKGLNPISLIDTSAYVSVKATVGDSTLVAPKAIINSGAKIGLGCIINSGAIIEHECFMGDFAHIAPGAVLAGNVNVGQSAFLGANCVVRQGIKIGDNAIIGAGAVVVKDVPKGEIWMGNPAKRQR